MTRNAAKFLIFSRKVLRRVQGYGVYKVWAFAVIIGAAAAYGVIGFRHVIDAVSLLAFGETEGGIVSGASSLHFFRAWMAPVIGGLVVSAMLYLADRFKWLEAGRPQGVADVIEARAVGGGHVSLRTGLATAAVSAVSLGAGASAGREGPAVHLGATIASIINRYLGFDAKQRRALLGCGAAAAVSASFNAPIAGVLFALEVILGNYALSVFGPIAAASVSAAIVTRIHLGDSPAFTIPEYGASGTIDVPLAALLGLLCGFLASGFLQATERMTLGVRDFAQKRGISYLLLPPIGGVIVGFIGAAFPETFGVGYQAVTKALRGDYAIHLLMVLVLMKCAATAITLSCRFGGGVFSPGLVIGAFAGAAFGGMLGVIFPGLAASPVYYAMIGMGAASGAILGAPISTTLIVFEMTGDYSITIALMVAVAIATLVTQWLCGRSFFHWQLSRRGYDLSEGPQGIILKTIRVREVMEKMPPGAPLSDDADRLETRHSLGEALAKLNEAEEHGLPVVDADEPSVIVGYLSRVKALAAYNKALIDQNIEHHT
ncbi:chloride channel protein [Hyphococcus flavus]|uniref:Chloride channel protein n=1 Tax=Hyphococcus flavus TaxID=1866326 RepID=A0AAE9ZC27_9PROT|nr:chloride channel protein [Hyphococcus flavus]WDI32078.1 chloride channel protein [Hyphococcus flavus]